MKSFYPLCTLFLISFFLLCGTTSMSAQDKYYRYFELNIKTLTQDQAQLLTGDLNGKSGFELHATCPDKGKIVVKVDTAYPKRVPEIEEELKAFAGQRVKSKNILSVRTVPMDERNEICQ